MSLTSVFNAKESTSSYKPLLLAIVTFGDGTTLRLTTDVRGDGSSLSYGGNTYLPRLSASDVAAIQSQSEQGVDQVPSVSLTISDPDCFVLLNYEMGSLKGFKGATLTLTFVYYDYATGAFSSDSRLKFTGICDEPEIGQTEHRVTAVNSLNMQKTFLPAVRIQKRCPWIFPPDVASQIEGNSDPSSDFWECGYYPGGGVGTGSYTTCDYTVAACKARGMLD